MTAFLAADPWGFCSGEQAQLCDDELLAADELALGAPARAPREHAEDKCGASARRSVSRSSPIHAASRSSCRVISPRARRSQRPHRYPALGEYMTFRAASGRA
jgi:hypothetical protein